MGRPAGWNDHGCVALGRDGLQTDEIVQELHAAAAELFNLGERVRFAAPVVRHQLLSDAHCHLRWREVPRADRMMTGELRHEILESDPAGSRAGARTDDGVEGFRIAGVEHCHGMLRRTGRHWSERSGDGGTSLVLQGGRCNGSGALTLAGDSERSGSDSDNDETTRTNSHGRLLQCGCQRQMRGPRGAIIGSVCLQWDTVTRRVV